ncbi:MAG: 4Fe-4S binding protein [Anaerolineae bacterium]|nr:4Fe-4S binding protein [Anaerolineae bacterium]
MFGSGVLKGLGVTLKEFVTTYIDDIKQIPSRYLGGKEEIDQSKVTEVAGLFTIQYPEERRKLPERFRYIPMLIYDAETGEDRCTACGICAKVCPPQCIWIVRAKDETGKPVTKPAEFYIDTTICMNCGLCAEFCPFDAIKMNHDFEIAAYQRMPHLVFDLKELSVPTTYYARIRPTDWAAEEAARKAKEAEKAAARPAPKAETAAPKPAPAASAAPAAPAAPPPPAPAARTPEEIERLKAEAAARRAAKAAAEAESQKPEAGSQKPETVVSSVAPQPPAAEAGPTGVGAKRTPEEIERLKAEAAARRAAKAAGEAGSQKVEAESQKPEAGVSSAAPQPAASAAEAGPTGVGRHRSPEEIERLKAEAAARRAAKAAQSEGDQK